MVPGAGYGRNTARPALLRTTTLPPDSIFFLLFVFFILANLKDFLAFILLNGEGQGLLRIINFVDLDGEGQLSIFFNMNMFFLIWIFCSARMGDHRWWGGCVGMVVLGWVGRWGIKNLFQSSAGSYTIRPLTLSKTKPFSFLIHMSHLPSEN